MAAMYLNDLEKAMLAGRYGQGTALAMKIQVAVGECFDAKRMVPISRAHVALSNQEADLWFVEKLLGLGARCRVAPTVNPGFHLAYCRQHLPITPLEDQLMARTEEAYREIGAVLTYCCTPYLETNVPRFGEVVSFSETSATAYVNAVIGARTNRESVQSSLCAAITGRVPEYGCLLAENRLGTVLVDVQARMDRDFDYQLLGACTKKIGYGVPVFRGLPDDPSQEALINLGAQLNTTGAYALFHIPGVTPEAPTLAEAFGGREPERTVAISDDDLAEVQAAISCPEGKIDFAMFGCPHFTIRQVAQVADLLRGRKLQAELWILTSTLNKELADRMGLLQAIEEAGGHLLDNTCIDQPCFRHLEGKLGVTDSPKCAYYNQRRGLDFVIRDLTACVQAAIKGAF